MEFSIHTIAEVALVILALKHLAVMAQRDQLQKQLNAVAQSEIDKLVKQNEEYRSQLGLPIKEDTFRVEVEQVEVKED